MSLVSSSCRDRRGGNVGRQGVVVVTARLDDGHSAATSGRRILTVGLVAQHMAKAGLSSASGFLALSLKSLSIAIESGVKQGLLLDLHSSP